MSSASPPRAYSSRLNPFAFPSDTTFRFILLIVAVLGASLYIYVSIYYRVNGEAHRRASFQCGRARDAAFPPKTIDRTDLSAYSEANDFFRQCLAPTNRLVATWMAGGVALVVSIAGVLYWISPTWIIWRRRLAPLRPEEAPEVVAYLAALCREAEVSRQPQFVWNPLSTASNGLAFGRPGRYYIALSGGVVAQFYTDQLAFRAIVLHELAHLRNTDIGKTYFTVAIWRAFVIAALLPFAVMLRDQGDPLDTFGLIWRMLALTALVYLTRNAILRARELYADVRASAWDGPTGRLRHVLALLPSSIGGRWRAMLSVHPDPAERQQALDNPSRLMRLRFWDAVGTGVAATIAFSNVEYFLAYLISDAPLRSLGAGLIFAPLIASVMGFGVWRATFSALMRGGALRGIWRIGLGLGLGALLGSALSLDQSSFEALNLLAGDNPITRFGLEALWSLMFLISLVAFVAWITACASTWLEVAVTRRSPRAVTIGGAAVAGTVLAVWLGLLYSTHDAFLALLALESAVVASLAGIAIYVLMQPLVPLALICLWAFPLAAWFWQRRSVSSSAPSWALLDPSPSFVLLPQAPLRPRLALSVGVIGSVPFFGLLLLVWIIRRWGISEQVRGTDQAILIFYYGQILVAALFQAIIAAVVAGWVRRLGVLHGLLAAFLAGCCMTIAILGLNLAFGGTITFGFAWQTYLLVLNGGALLALVFAPFVAALAGWMRRMRLASGRRRMADAVLLHELLAGAPSVISGPAQTTERLVQDGTQ